MCAQRCTRKMGAVGLAAATANPQGPPCVHDLKLLGLVASSGHASFQRFSGLSDPLCLVSDASVLFLPFPFVNSLLSGFLILPNTLLILPCPTEPPIRSARLPQSSHPMSKVCSQKGCHLRKQDCPTIKVV